MHRHAAFQIQHAALSMRASHPNATALSVLDQAMTGHTAADLPLQRWAADRAMPVSPFGQLLLDAFGCCMTAREWRAYTSDAADPELATAVMNIWPTLVIAGLTERYRGPHADGALGGMVRTPLQRAQRADASAHA